MQGNIARVAVPVPLRQGFDFKIPNTIAPPAVGARVRVPFGQRKLIGVVLSVEAHSEVPAGKLKDLLEVIDAEPVFDPHLWRTLTWLANYYLAPIGEVIDTALPVLLRHGNDLQPTSEVRWRLSEQGRAAALDELKRAPLQLALIKRFSSAESLCPADFKSESGGWRQAVKALVGKQWLQEFSAPPHLLTKTNEREPVTLNTAQSQAAEHLVEQINRDQFSCTLLHGVTGSGKTEVYFAAMRRALALGKQVLLLVPEIGLTPQLVQRIEQSFSCGVVALHSSLSDQARHTAWWHARSGNAQIVIGTRSAIFVPLRTPGLIVVDEEHDSSFKQQDGVRYHARDVAVYHARQLGIPIVLGSATPALETLHNAQQGRYHLSTLEQRASDSTLPTINLLDLRTLPNSDGLSPPMLEAIKTTVEKGQQAMLFLNRRGFAPVQYCKSCGETSKCHRCDSHLTFHQSTNRLRCHHCGYETHASGQCGSCQQPELASVGEGTQRVEDALRTRLPSARVLRIDRDSTRLKGELEDKLAQVANHEVDIVLGTQLLAKGHDFSGVTMVGILGADQGLYSTDFRARETLFQQVLQVGGRAGRRAEPGRVFIQTAFPDETFFDYVREHNYQGFSQQLLLERETAGFPPFGYFAVLRAESTHQSKALQFLRRVKRELINLDQVTVMDAVPAPMEKRAGRYRAQLLIKAQQRKPLHGVLSNYLDRVAREAELKKLAATVRWSLDVDPIDLF